VTRLEPARQKRHLIVLLAYYLSLDIFYIYQEFQKLRSKEKGP